jgi:UDP-N-acetylglucosamine diphosphorylase / glucose-1-phosphate thymidylyltransferase / UDP-N-acetylgalactosamine diphosphorylase / glucosamine-1-phosphate N-acetyltransferase / galactosamine-1-phosphate N-acetyltransferase
VVTLDDPASEDEARVVLSSRAVLVGTDSPGPGEAGDGSEPRRVLEAALQDALGSATGGGPVRIQVGGDAAGWILPPGVHLPPEGPTAGEWAATVDPAGEAELEGRILDAPWTLVAENAAQLQRDLAGSSMVALGEGGTLRLPSYPGVEVLGEHPVTAGGPLELDPQVVLDAREGPIHLEAGATIRPFTHLRGPAFIGAGSTLLGGIIEAVSVGPGCKLRGEISHAVILGWSNKAHDGHLGHALVGSWVNLGAGTTNSDLKNTYSTVRVPQSPEREADSGLLKVGAFLGDHVKTGIGTLLNTGTVAGVGSNVFVGPGGAMPPKWIPPFAWGSGDRLVPYDLPRFLETASRAMARRGQALSPGMRRVLTRAWERTHGPATYRLPGETDV